MGSWEERNNRIFGEQVREAKGMLDASLFALPSLKSLYLSYNQFSGHLDESTFESPPQLEELDLGGNKLEGPIPLSIFNISSLVCVYLDSNQFNGTLELNRFEALTNLSALDLSENLLSIDTNNINSALFPKVSIFKLRSCNLRSSEQAAKRVKKSLQALIDAAFRNENECLRIVEENSDINTNEKRKKMTTTKEKRKEVRIDESDFFNLLNDIQKGKDAPNDKGMEVRVPKDKEDEARITKDKREKMRISKEKRKEKSEKGNDESIPRVELWIKGRIKKDGNVVNRASMVTMKKIKESSQDSNYKSSFLIKDYLLSQVIGPEHPGCVRGLGFGATFSNINAQLQVVSWKQAMNNKVNEVMERQKVMEEIISQLTSSMNIGRNGVGNACASKDVLASHRDDNGNLEGKPCKLLHWIASGEVVAYGEISSTDPSSLVDDVPLGPDCYKLWDMSQPTPTQESAAKDLHGFDFNSVMCGGGELQIKALKEKKRIIA
ncbi:hypothetical protein Sjap_022151 [Stephania japonica]|uniref:Uncharacterized protein n=1 Tax=Stephania japonica TaxID=461633 RepID=A0AAP0EX45_9MAGN